MKVIGFTGLPGSGKTTAVDAVRDLGKVVTMGDVIRKETEKRGLKPTDKNLGNTARDLREQGGTIAIARKCVELIEDFHCKVVFIDGIRSHDEVKVFKCNWDFQYIAIMVQDTLRFERIQARGRNDDPKTLEELRIRDAREIQFGIQEAIEKADFHVTNNSSEKEMKKKVREIVQNILSN